MYDPEYADLYKWMNKHGPREWHQIAQSWNWTGGFDPLLWIIRHDDCDRGTALLLFHIGQPIQFAGLNSREAIAVDAPRLVEQFDFLVEIVKRATSRGFKTELFDVHEDYRLQSMIEPHKEELVLAGNLQPWTIPSSLMTPVANGQIVEWGDFDEGMPYELIED